MTDSTSISGWKKLAIRAFFGGVGFAIALAIIAANEAPPLPAYRSDPPWAESL